MDIVVECSVPHWLVCNAFRRCPDAFRHSILHIKQHDGEIEMPRMLKPGNPCGGLPVCGVICPLLLDKVSIEIKILGVISDRKLVLASMFVAVWIESRSVWPFLPSFRHAKRNA